MEPLMKVPHEITLKKLEYCLPNWNSTLNGQKTLWLLALSWKNLIERVRQSFQDLSSVVVSLWNHKFGTLLKRSIIVFNFYSRCPVYYVLVLLDLMNTLLNLSQLLNFIAQTYNFLQYSDGFLIGIEVFDKFVENWNNRLDSVLLLAKGILVFKILVLQFPIQNAKSIN